MLTVRIVAVYLVAESFFNYYFSNLVCHTTTAGYFCALLVTFLNLEEGVRSVPHGFPRC